jgi:hypothetical protein
MTAVDIFCNDLIIASVINQDYIFEAFIGWTQYSKARI